MALFTANGSVVIQPGSARDMSFIKDGVPVVALDNSIVGSASVEAPAASFAATGKEVFAASGSVTAPTAILNGSAKERFTASGMITAPAASLDASAKERFTASGSVAAPAASFNGSGTVETNTPVGDGDVDAPPAVIGGIGTVTGGTPPFNGQVQGSGGANLVRPIRRPDWLDQNERERVLTEQQDVLLELGVI